MGRSPPRNDMGTQAVPLNNPPGAAVAGHSMMLSPSASSVIADGVSSSVVKIQARDVHGINLTSGGSTVVFASTLGTLSSTTDIDGDGTYQATLTSTTVGIAKVTATLGNQTIGTTGTATNFPERHRHLHYWTCQLRVFPLL